VDGDYRIDGEKRVVLHAPGADLLVVSARIRGEAADADGIALFLIDANAPGITQRRCQTLDAQRAADVVFADVHVSADALLGDESQGLLLIEHVVDYATALIC